MLMHRRALMHSLALVALGVGAGLIALLVLRIGGGSGETVDLFRVACRTQFGFALLDDVYRQQADSGTRRYVAIDGGGLVVPAGAWCLEEPVDAQACMTDTEHTRLKHRGACGTRTSDGAGARGSGARTG